MPVPAPAASPAPAAAPAEVPEQAAAPSSLGEAQAVAKGVWFLAGDVAKGEANSVVIEMPEYLIVVDAGYPARAMAVQAMVAKLSPKPVKYVFDTHAHGDHLYGNAVWTAAGAETMAFAGVKADLDRWEPGRWNGAKSVREDVQISGKDAPQAPTKILDGDRFTLSEGGRTVEFLSFGWGHTSGDGFVWLPKERVLATGDAAVNGPYTYLSDGWLDHWPRVLEQAIELQPAIVLPGHGPAGNAAILVGQRRFLIDLNRLVGEEIAFGRTPAQMHFHLPERDQPWVPSNLRPDIDAAYAELRGRVPVGLIEPAKP